MRVDFAFENAPLPRVSQYSSRLGLPFDTLALGQCLFIDAPPDVKREIRAIVEQDARAFTLVTGKGLLVRSNREPSGVRVWAISIPSEFLKLG